MKPTVGAVLVPLLGALLLAEIGVVAWAHAEWRARDRQAMECAVVADLAVRDAAQDAAAPLPTVILSRTSPAPIFHSNEIPSMRWAFKLARLSGVGLDTLDCEATLRGAGVRSFRRGRLPDGDNLRRVYSRAVFSLDGRRAAVRSGWSRGGPLSEGGGDRFVILEKRGEHWVVVEQTRDELWIS